MNLLHLLQDHLQSALAGYVPEPERYRDAVKPTREAKFGDYQANLAMPLQKVLGKKPREIAAEIVQRIPLAEMLETPEIAGPGFINLRFKSEWLARQLQKLTGDERLGVPAAGKAHTFVIDYSSPNVAKPMHVGHLRSSIIGDALTRLMRFLGHRVVTDNHLGDWGTQFGMLIYGYKHFRDEAALKTDPVREMTRLYLLVRAKIKEAGAGEEEEEEAHNPVAEACRAETAKLHAGDSENTKLWLTMMPWCLEELNQTYQRLGILPFDHTLGESFYNPWLTDVVTDLRAKGIAVEGNRGAIVVRHSEDENEPPSLVQKRDGAFTYTTTDLATIRYRVEHFHPDIVLYVVDIRQSLHFTHLFAIARRWGYDKLDLEHVGFGTVLGEDKTPIKTREGRPIELSHLLDEAVKRAMELVKVHSPDLPEEQRPTVAEVVGIGAVKYADLMQNRTSDYVFSWEKMMTTDGNSGAYLQYAYARNCSILRKSEVDIAELRANSPIPTLGTAEERALAMAILRFPEALEAARAEYKPNAITSYLYDLGSTYSGFFQNCPVLKAETPDLRRSRLLLCDLTARVLQRGLDMLGIRTIEQM